MKLHFKGWNICSEMLLTILLGNPHIFTQLFTLCLNGCVRSIARRVFEYVMLFFYVKRLIRRQVLCDCILAPKRNSYTKGYLLEVQVENFHCTSTNHHIWRHLWSIAEQTRQDGIYLLKISNAASLSQIWTSFSTMVALNANAGRK